MLCIISHYSYCTTVLLYTCLLYVVTSTNVYEDIVDIFQLARNIQLGSEVKAQ